MPVSQQDRTYRVWGLPAGISFEDSELMLKKVLDLSANNQPKVHSLGLDPYASGRDVDLVATVTFLHTPRVLHDGNSWRITKSISHRFENLQLSLSIDTHFRGWTPLNTIKDDEDHKIDCIAVSGLSSHPFGSWKQRGGQFMWLRDSLASSSNGVRVLLYGYDTYLVGTESFQDIEDIGNKLDDFIKPIRPRMGERGFTPRPIVFIAHSLGGILVKQAICRMASRDWWNAQCVYGFVFFGVPNQGIRITHWLPMVKNQPNENLVRNLAPGSPYLQNLHEKFCQELKLLQNSTIISVYETVKSKTAKEKSPGYWTLTGSTEVLVTRDSATDSYPSGLNHHCMPVNQNHADLPKFEGPHDCEYQLLSVYLNHVWQEAAGNVQFRFCTAGFTTRESSRPYQRTKENDEAMLHAAASNNYVDAVNLLLDQGVSIEARDAKTFSSLHSAASNGSNKAVKVLLDRGADIYATTVRKYTALHLASEKGHLHVVKLLLDRNVDIEMKSYAHDRNALHMTAIHGRIEIMKLLLARGADVHAKTTEESTALHLAAENGHLNLVQLLLDRKANVKAKDRQGRKPVNIAITEGHVRVVELLKSYQRWYK